MERTIFYFLISFVMAYRSRRPRSRGRVKRSFLVPRGGIRM